MDAVLRLRLTTKSQPVGIARARALCGFEQRARSRLWTARRGRPDPL